MPRPRRAPQQPSISSGQASYVIDRMVADRRVSPSDILRYVSEMQTEIDELERRLQSLRTAAGGGQVSSAPVPRRRGRPPGSRSRRITASSAAAGRTPPASKRRRRRRRTAITAEQLASRKLQGRYLGLIRQIPKRKRGQYQKTAKEKGREAAIKEMAAALGK